MAIVGFGTDIVEIERIAAAISRNGDAFAQRILSEREFAIYTQSKKPERFLAKRFAVKEAASKALGTGIAQGVSLQDFTVLNDELGKPWLQLSGKAEEFAQSFGVNAIHLSISDERRYAVASVILENNTGH
ncbi:holo-ACP synthase [Vibrio spartinae]|uniref:Holo-[acyl-carrier-protein] synthase n=1 Tax=Vibrio spartinae TaxID=1918945 RepID=A0A1N6M400_9VIBR|nr:holo-ACP synthase [Vibrio spartinae]QMV13292.1 Holo-[acyl-carrier-protein] synthase [Vibrio spartinae]SIO94173.1 Holo-[acyl-carrier-protein] synthase [Vibrio spartinae]